MSKTNATNKPIIDANKLIFKTANYEPTSEPQRLPPSNPEDPPATHTIKPS
jgi:hypothetical protein